MRASVRTQADVDRPADPIAGGPLTPASILAHAPAIVYVYDLAAGASVYQNRPLAPLLGYDAAAAAGFAGGEWRALMHPDDQARFPAHREQLRALGVGQALTFEYRMRHADGSWHWILSHDVVVDAGPGGSPASGLVVGSAADTTELRLAVDARRATEEALREGEARYRTLVARMDQGFCVLELIRDGTGRAIDYRFLEVNAQFELHTGLRDAVGRTARELVPGLEQHWIDAYAEVADTGVSRTFEEGSAAMGRLFEVEAMRIDGPADRHVALLFRDVTARRSAEQALADAQARLRATLEAGAIGTFAVDMASGTVMADAHVARLHGLDPAVAAEGVPGVGFLAAMHPDDAVLVRDRQARVARAAGPFEMEYRVPDERGGWRTLQVRGDVERRDGVPARLAGAVVEITALKAAEAGLREREARLEAALRVKDEFLGLVSHELRTPMTVILGMSRLLAAGQLDPDRSAEIAVDVAESAEVLNELVEAMLLLARLDEAEAGQLREPVLLHRLAGEVIDTLAARNPAVCFELRSDEQPPIVAVQRTWLARVVENLAGNAVKYGARNVVVVVDRDGLHARLRVLDDGPGLGDDADRLFEPFYRAARTRERAPGVGLGLAVAQRIIDLSGGRVWGRTRDEGGAEFGFVLPPAPDDG